jgi:hypothetical protein
MLYPLANFANLLMWGLVFVGATWAYVKYRSLSLHFVEFVNFNKKDATKIFSLLQLRICRISRKSIFRLVFNFHTGYLFYLLLHFSLSLRQCYIFIMFDNPVNLKSKK